jgi:hypothetical protein
MIDEQERLPSKHEMDGDGYLYDYFKYLTSLSLITLGGILTVSQMSRAEPVDKPSLLLMVAVLSTAGVLSFVGSEEIVRGKATGKRNERTLRLCRITAPKIYIFGAAILFTQFFWM